MAFGDFTIQNGKDIPVDFKQGSIPDLSGAITDWFQTLTFEGVTKTNVGGFVAEVGTSVTFQGFIDSFTARQLYLKPEGQRAWTWFMCIAYPVLELAVDDVLKWNGVPTRVMYKDPTAHLRGLAVYHLAQNWQDGL